MTGSNSSMSKLDSQLKDHLKNCSKDEASCSKLEEIFSELYGRYETLKNQLDLLERAIKHDYDSILITELNLEKPGPRIVYVNDGFTRMTGYSKEEVIGKTPRILQGPRTDRHVLDRLKKRLIEGQAFFGHTINYKKDGTEFVNQWDIHPLTNNNGDITHWVSYQRDITDRQESSKMLFDANIDFEKLEEESKRTFVDLDVQGNIISSNKSFRELLGYDVDELKSKKIWDLVSDNDQPELKELFSDFEAGSIENKPYPWTFVNSSEDELLLEGDIRWFVSGDQTVIRVHFDNISMRNRVIETLKKKTMNLDSLLNKHEEFTVKFVKEGEDIVCTYVSDSFSDITGLDKSEVLEHGITGVLSSECRETANSALVKAFEGNLTTDKFSYQDQNGDKLNVIQSFKPIWDETEKEVVAVKSVALIELDVES